MSTEFERAARLVRTLGVQPPPPYVVVPNGDDGAVLRIDGELVVTTDALVENVDFARFSPWDSVGHKALAANLSDLAACGADPLAWTLVLCLPKAFEERHLDELAAGMAGQARTCGITCVRGDLSSTSGPVVISITALGRVPAGSALRRGGAHPGDGVYVSGTLGAAAAGLRVLLQDGAEAGSLDEQLARFPDARVREAVKAQLAPEPRIALGVALRGVASACIDVTDGFAQDLCHLLMASGAGARIDTARLPAHPAVAIVDAVNARQLTLAGGEEMELLFTAPDEEAVTAAAARARTPVTRIGDVVAGVGLALDGMLLSPDDVAALDAGKAPAQAGAAFLKGYAHF